MGRSCRFSNPYEEVLTPNPHTFPENAPLQPMVEDSPMYVNGQQVRATLDGLPISWGTMSSLIDHGSVAVGYTVHISGRGFHTIQAPIDSYGGGLFGHETPPTWVRKIPNGEGGFRHTDNGGYNHFSFNFGSALVGRRDTAKAKALRQQIIQTAIADALAALNSSEDCRKYILDNKNLNKDYSDTISFLEALQKDGAIVDSGTIPYEFDDEDGQKGEAIAVTNNVGKNAAIGIYKPFFEKKVGGKTSSYGINTRKARAQTILHELKHAFGGEHNTKNKIKDGTSVEFNEEIKEKCLKYLKL